jgi:hypothetical protein
MICIQVFFDDVFTFHCEQFVKHVIARHEVPWQSPGYMLDCSDREITTSPAAPRDDMVIGAPRDDMVIGLLVMTYQ